MGYDLPLKGYFDPCWLLISPIECLDEGTYGFGAGRGLL